MVTNYVTNIGEFRTLEIVAVRANRCGENLPTGTLVQVVRLADPAYKVEVQAIAGLP